jgi:hypothetical protein
LGSQRQQSSMGLPVAHDNKPSSRPRLVLLIMLRLLLLFEFVHAGLSFQFRLHHQIKKQQKD